ncbi:MAG TPA: tripartite tricarboxylate transporter substrate-binding protein [Alphaproteobacteria bacterium]
MSLRLPLRLAIGAIAATLALPALAADPFPARPIHIIAPWGVGTPPDIVARILGDNLAPRFGQPVIVDNKPGATGTIGLAELARQPADGHTLATITMPVTVASALYPDLKLDLSRDFAPIGLVGWASNVLVVNAHSPAASVPELLSLLRAKPGQLAFASGGNGTPAHLAGELFLQTTGTAANHVPYNQFPQAVADVIAGRVEFMFMSSVAAIAQVQGGSLRALAVTAPERIAALPAVPTMVEAGHPDVVVRDWSGVIAKAGTPEPVLARLRSELAEALRSAVVRERLAQIGIEPDIQTAAAFGDLIRSETARWSQLVQTAGIKPN